MSKKGLAAKPIHRRVVRWTGGLLALFLLLAAGGAPAGTAPSVYRPVLEDGFETETPWQLFEEIVGGSPCYGEGIGSAERSTGAASAGIYSFRVWANTALSDKSNHVIGYRQVSNSGQGGAWRYRVRAYLAPETEGEGQTGPEFSMQNTREVQAGVLRTLTAGVQYLANPFAPDLSAWQVWGEVSPGVATWQPFMTQTLESGVWYTLTLEADYGQATYRTFSLEGGGLDLVADLSVYGIAAEDKFDEEAFVITLEGENLWNNCGAAGVYDFQVLYDEVSLERATIQFLLPIIFR